MLVDGEAKWIDVRFSAPSSHDYRGASYFEVIPRAYLGARRGQAGRIGGSQSYLFDAVDLDQFAVHWLEEHLGAPTLEAPHPSPLPGGEGIKTG